MTRIPSCLLAALLLTVCLASPAEAQRAPRTTASVAGAPSTARVSLGSGSRYAPDGVATSDLALSFQPTDTLARAPGRAMHRTGTTLMVIALNAQIAGAVGGFFGLIVPWGGCNDVCGGGPLNVALFSTGMVTAGLGLVAFFVGLGLDIRGRIDRRSPSRLPLAVTPNGVALTF